MTAPSEHTHLGTEVGHLHGERVVHGHALDACQRDVLGCIAPSSYQCPAVHFLWVRVPISTPSPFMPTTSTLDVAIFFIAVNSKTTVSLDNQLGARHRTFMSEDIAESRGTSVQSRYGDSWAARPTVDESRDPLRVDKRDCVS